MVPELHLPRFLSLFATSHARVHFSRGFPVLTTFRPQAFSASRRLAPHARSRACFISLPRPGFHLFRGFSPRAATLPLRKERAPLPLLRRRLCPHASRSLHSDRQPEPSRARAFDSGSRARSAPTSHFGVARLRGFHLREAAFHESGYSPRPRPLPSSVSSPPGPFCPRRQRRFTRRIPLMMFPSSAVSAIASRRSQSRSLSLVHLQRLLLASRRLVRLRSNLPCSSFRAFLPDLRGAEGSSGFPKGPSTLPEAQMTRLFRAP